MGAVVGCKVQVVESAETPGHPGIMRAGHTIFASSSYPGN